MEPPAKRAKLKETSTRRINKNIFLDHLRVQQTGRGFTHIHQVPECVMTRIDPDWEDCEDEVPRYVKGLQKYRMDDRPGPLNELFSNAKTLFEKLTSFERRTNSVADNDGSRYEVEDRNAQLFVEVGGIEAVVNIIMFESCLPECSPHREESEDKLRMKAVLFEIIGRVITTETVGEQVAISLTEDIEFLHHMFHYLRFDQTFLAACALIEDILQNKPVLRLESIPNLNELIIQLAGEPEKLANFAKILAVTISDLDVYDNKSSLFAQNKEKRQNGFINVRDVNHEYLLALPDLLKNLVKLACTKDYTPRYRGLNGEVENWMQWIDDTNSDDLLDAPDSDNDSSDFIGAISLPSNYDGPWTKQPSMKCIEDLIYKVEVIYVLGLFLTGKHRKRAQKKLAQLNLLPGLSELFENFIWKPVGHRTAARNRLRGHNASCECSPEVALKIQFLRLVHSFCDHSEYKHLLLTRSELNEIIKINDKADMLAIEGLENTEKKLMCKGKEGLITKIVEVLKKEPSSSTFRFWLARSVESYLRGPTSFCDQVFLLRRGILQHVVNNMMEADSRPKEIIQSGFDLLGELIKFNIEAFKIIEDVLRTPEMRKKFLGIVNQNLVDSNMFIRSAILSFGFFINEATEHEEYARNTNVILKYMGNFQQQVNYLHEMINLTNVQNITQENVSCLNTTLVFLMSATKTSTMEPYLKALKEEKITYSEERVGGGTVMNNFRELLLFWKDHYLHKDKDCSALEKSSRIPFETWKQTVITLINEDSTQPTAISYYIDNPLPRSQ